MPGTTDTQGLQYDLLTENVATATETGLERLAKGIATELDNADTARTTALKRPAARASRFLTVQSIPNNATTAITFDVENFDSHAMVNLGTNAQRVTITAGGGAGVYMVAARLDSIFTNNTGKVELLITKNGAELFRQTVFAESNGLAVAGISLCIVGDFFGVSVFQNSGAARDADTVRLEVWKISQ
jgi:hypothetical protein